MFFNRISVKIAVWATLAFLAGALILFQFTSYLLHQSLKNKDYELLELEFKNYLTLLDTIGIEGIKDRLDVRSLKNTSRFLVRYQSPTGETDLLQIPPELEIASKEMTPSELESHLQKEALNGPWIHVGGAEFGDDLVVLSKKLDSGAILQIGKDTEDREEFFDQFTHSFFLCLVPMLIVSTVFGGFLSAKVLSPIRGLTQTARKIYSGQLDARVSLSGNGDELDQLGALFNQMLQKNQRLVQGMKETLDSIAHDLKTPIMRLQISAQSALQTQPTTQVESAYYEALGDCQENSELIHKMLNTIMDISEAEAGTMSLIRQQIEVASLFENVKDLYLFVAEERRIRIEIQKSLPEVNFVGDSVRLLQALANLLDNAIKYSPSDSVVTLKYSCDGKFVHIDVIDEGLGIPADELPRIWDRLYRGDKSRSTRGLGLGLSLVRAITKAHSGTAQAENNIGGGCTFRLMLPLNGCL